MAEDEERLVPLTDLSPDEDEVNEEDDNGGSGNFPGESNRRNRDQEDCCACYSRNVNSLSIQSGDIVTSPPQPQPRTLPRGKLYTKLFPVVHKIVKYVFFSERVPISPLIILLLLTITTFLVGIGVWWRYPPTYNISIESVQVPDHSSSLHWDAYQAAVLNQIYNDTEEPSSVNVTKKHFDSDNEFRSEVKRDCCSSPICIQRMHGSWILELVYRVRSGRKNKNLLEDDRIKHLHSIERYIYNLDSYKKVCHYFPNTQVCDPINSLLTYIYEQRMEDGSYVNDAIPPADWKSKLDPSKLSEEKLEKMLWYTGGQINGNFETELLRAQVGISQWSTLDVFTIFFLLPFLSPSPSLPGSCWCPPPLLLLLQ